MTNVNGLELLYACFNQYLFQDAKDHVSDLLYYINTNPNYIGNKLAENLVEAIRDYDFNALGSPLFQSILARTGKTPAESNMILGEIWKYKQFTKEQIAPVRKTLYDISAGIIMTRAYKKFQDHPSDLIHYIKSLDIKTTDTSDLSTVALNKVDINSIIAQNSNNVIPSKFNFINESFSSGGYEKGEMVLICMPPGQGKSLFMLEEMMNMALSGHKCHILTMGDLKLSDQIIRMAAIYSGLSFKDAKINLFSIYNRMSSEIGDNLSFTIVPAGVTSVEEYIEFIEDIPELEVLGIDYDSNFDLGGSVDSMYDAYGKIYQELTKLTDDEHDKLVFVACQPKVNVWSEPVLSLPDIGESSRKQHSADMIITRGRDTASPNHLGPMNIAKNRRGETDVIEYSIRLGNGRTRILPKQVYMDIRAVKDKRNFTDKDIDDFINAWKASRGTQNGNLQNGISMMGGNQQTLNNRPGFNTPFENDKF